MSDGSWSGVRPDPGSGRRIATMAGMALLILVLAGCAGQASSGRRQAFAQVSARIDYPVQLIVGQTDVVTLSLSPRANLLGGTATSATGASVSSAVPLPTDVSDYQDIGVWADALGDGTSALAWQLTTPYRQSLLSAPGTGGTRTYVPVTFRWRVLAISAGRSTQRIVLGLYYVHRDGSEHDGSVALGATPVPIRGVAATLLNSVLPPLRLPIAGIAGLLGMLALLRFLWGARRARRSRDDAWERPDGLPGPRYGNTRQGRAAGLPSPRAPQSARQLPPARRRRDGW